MLRGIAGLAGCWLLVIALIAPTLAASQASKANIKAKPKASPAVFPNRLDTTFIHSTYIDGDFDRAVEMLEDAMKYGGPFSHQDSIFIFKHLGVMYAAKYETRENGKHFMLQLLNVEPTAKIMDMYASDMIYMIFKNIQDEFASSKPSFARPDPGPNPSPDPENPKKKTRYAWVGWTASVVAAAGGIALAIHMMDEEKAVSKENVVHEN